MRIRARWALGAATAAGLGAIVTGSLPGGAARAQEADTALHYTCAFPSGTSEKVDVRVQGTFPAAGTTGRPVQPGRVTVTVTIPASAEVTGLGGATVVGTARLGTSVTQNGEATAVGWPGLATPATPVPADADLVLAASGDVPPVTPAGTGDLSFAAGDLALTLAPRDANGGEPKDAKPPLAITCEAPGDQVIATVPVSAGATPAPAAPAAPKAGPKAAEPPGGTPAECGKYAGPTDDWYPGCTYLSGFSNVKKLKGATVLNDPRFGRPALTNLVYSLTDTGAAVRQKFVAPLRSRSTFLTFGFMPTTATMELTQRPLKPGEDYGTFEAVSDMQTGIQSVSAHMRMSIRIYDVQVNGTPLDVGPRCRTARDVDITLKGQMPNILQGGILDGAFTIPPFSGCGVGENLDPLFSGTVAGPGNLLRVSLGSTCIPDADISCPPALPEPSRSAVPQS
ncbi:DUF6801 domain-containing protein [Actinomadura latina]|uniref:DUF6801 domain-containing protein n=1 Tax=Actinomadura latina TaxID=163603 RepID=A0A846ZD50_9ACTN|nr:DUF6801 domain-containing protein [Actinomadura latina]NKZ09152.1 hypothetical protein [Actinomadura latina]